MTLTPEKLDEIEAGLAGVMTCRQCGSPATLRAHFQTGGTEIFCDPCVQDHEAISNEIDAHEMQHFGGAYGLVPRPKYTPIASHHGLDPQTVAELVRLARIGRDLEQGREVYVRGVRVHVPVGEPGDF